MVFAYAAVISSRSHLVAVIRKRKNHANPPGRGMIHSHTGAVIGSIRHIQKIG
jgi:hypothetical protein